MSIDFVIFLMKWCRFVFVLQFFRQYLRMLKCAPKSGTINWTDLQFLYFKKEEQISRRMQGPKTIRCYLEIDFFSVFMFLPMTWELKVQF